MELHTPTTSRYWMWSKHIMNLRVSYLCVVMIVTDNIPSTMHAHKDILPNKAPSFFESGMEIRPNLEGRVLQEVDGVGTGMLVIHRRALEQLHAHDPRTYLCTATGNRYYRFFDLEITEDRALWGEDYNFCRRWQLCGGKVYVATWVECAHWGTHKYGRVASLED